MSLGTHNRDVYRRGAVVEHFRRAHSLQPVEALLFSTYITRSDRLLDLGVGAGRTARFLADRAVYVGLDVVKEMVAAAQRELGETRLLAASAEWLPFGGASFDVVVFSFNGLGYLDARPLAYAEVRRVLKPGGLFLFSMHNARYVSSPGKMSARSLAKWATRVPADVAQAVFSQRLWRGEGLMPHHRVNADLKDLRSVSISRSRIVAELADHGLTVEAVFGGPRPTLSGPLAPWYYYAARR